MNPFVLKVIQWLIPVITPVLIGFIKGAATGAWDKVPEWARPLVAGLIGALAGIATGDTATVQATFSSAAFGAALGALGKAGRDAYREVFPAGVD